VRVGKSRGGAPPYGRIEKIIDRGIRAFVGRYAPAGKRPFVRFRDRDSDLLLEADVPPGFTAEAGDLVLAEVSEYPKSVRRGGPQRPVAGSPIPWKRSALP
jgi:exoribonuclease R